METQFPSMKDQLCKLGASESEFWKLVKIFSHAVPSGQFLLPLFSAEQNEPLFHSFSRILETDWVTEVKPSSLSSNPTPRSHFTNIPGIWNQDR